MKKDSEQNQVISSSVLFCKFDPGAILSRSLFEGGEEGGASCCGRAVCSWSASVTVRSWSWSWWSGGRVVVVALVVSWPGVTVRRTGWCLLLVM